MSAFSHFLLHRASATIFSFPFFVPQFSSITFFLLHDLSMESHIRILPLTVQSFPFPVFFLFASSCSTLSAFPPSIAPSQPFSPQQPHSLNQLPHPPVDPPNQWLPLCPSFRNRAPYPPFRWGSSSSPAPSSCLRITTLCLSRTWPTGFHPKSQLLAPDLRTSYAQSFRALRKTLLSPPLPFPRSLAVIPESLQRSLKVCQPPRRCRAPNIPPGHRYRPAGLTSGGEDGWLGRRAVFFPSGVKSVQHPPFSRGSHPAVI